MSKGTLLFDAGPDAVGAADFITRLLNGVTMAHMHHLMASSYAKHMALGALYDDLQEAADGLAEAFMGCCGMKLGFTGGTVAIGPDAIVDVQTLYSYVESNRYAMGMESHIQNEIDGVSTILSSALYKLKFLA